MLFGLKSDGQNLKGGAKRPVLRKLIENERGCFTRLMNNWHRKKWNFSSVMPLCAIDCKNKQGPDHPMGGHFHIPNEKQSTVKSNKPE